LPAQGGFALINFAAAVCQVFELHAACVICVRYGAARLPNQGIIFMGSDAHPCHTFIPWGNQTPTDAFCWSINHTKLHIPHIPSTYIYAYRGFGGWLPLPLPPPTACLWAALQFYSISSVYGSDTLSSIYMVG